MGEFTDIRIGAVRRLIEQAPDKAIRSLETALAHGGGGDRSMAAVQELVAAEVKDRKARAAVLAPLIPLCTAPRDGLQRLSFPYLVPALTWRGLKAVDPEAVAHAARLAPRLRPEDETPAVFDHLCRRAADGLRGQEPAFAALRQVLDGRGPGVAEQFILLLTLVPLARPTLRRLPTWVRNLSGEYAATIRVVFADAVAIDETAGPIFMEVLFGHLEEPRHVLRLISLVMDRPGDRYLAASELASFGERLLGDVDKRIEEVRRFDPSRGLEGGVALGASVYAATSIIHEFEQWLDISREGPWGARLAKYRRALAQVAEARLREIESAVVHALPSQPIRSTARTVRGMPKVVADPDQVAVVKAQALLGFLHESRSSANYVGFGALRTRTLEALDPHLDQYAEDLLEALHAGEQPAERLRAYLEVAAEFLGLVRDAKAAEIVRRRTAVA